ncbi:serine/threonine protein kinase [Streptomyces davaonensis JCM 4913]|uniref:non-specific serine/threonine protein kinase n=1 Tax=Streptomyces davaonensis (strain DSM 101723 / JCM 4913 / KCC S-0913 / 768) TaxID=1214101 RepID=K4R4G6_STRDJ|nr:serine/threonine-protein kinase [Streptomyces davaonensis]CCK28017.1 serine/threonine protein kinase [Streptomyces davaonensis JCM 4913]
MSEDGVGRGSKTRVVGGRYRLLERIGSGGMGTVWRALDELVEREVAVKEPRLPGDPEDEVFQRAAHRLYREARAAARVEHPSAVAIHDVVVEEQDGLPWIVMELVRGESLHELLKRGPLPPAESARIGLAVLGALRAAHSVGIVHRDVKPANVLLGPHDRVVLTDFGIAHVQGEESLTATGEFVGSLEFIAPERMSGRTAGPASDLWSLGVLLYAATEGWSPFRRTTMESTLAAILAVDPPEPKRAGELGPLLVRLLTKDPDGRPDAEETAAALEAVAGESAQADPAPQLGDELEEFGDDIGTVRLTPDPETAAEPISAVPMSAVPPRPAPATRPLHRRPLPLALLGGLLVGASWLGIAFLTDPDSGAATENTAARKPTPSPTDGWTAHSEKPMHATLALPAEYEEFARQGTAAIQPRVVEYADPDGAVQVRLTQWDKATGTPMSQAKGHEATWKIFGHASTQYTDTSFHGWDAVQADTTYGEPEQRTRVMELFVRTDDGRLYELRVEMPKGSAGEKTGTAVFKDARDRLRIATTP